jgi:hypothetical protein
MVSMAERDRVIAALAGTMLEGREVHEIALPETDDVAFEIEIELAELRSAWQLARGLVGQLERWPLAVSRSDGSAYNRFEYQGLARVRARNERVEVQDSRPTAIRRRASALTISDVLDFDTKNYAESRARDWSIWLDFHLAKTRKRVGQAPSVEDATRRVTTGDEIGLERLLLDFENEQGPPEIDVEGYMAWWLPPEGCMLTLLPTRQSEEALAYVSWFGIEQTSAEHAVCALRSWNERFGAELVANWGTMLDFVVSRPPEDLEGAFALATEHAAIAPSTMALPGFTIRDHARALLHRTEWRLHERP